MRPDLSERYASHFPSGEKVGITLRYGPSDELDGLAWFPASGLVPIQFEERDSLRIRRAAFMKREYGARRMP